MYKELISLGGEKLVEKSFMEFVEHRKQKEEKRKKRHRGDEETTPANGEAKKPKVDEEKEKFDALERRRKEILEQLQTGVSAPNANTGTAGEGVNESGEVEEGEVDSKR